MRTKESIDRETKELQERTWIYMLHHQAPPLTRHANPSGFIPLAPMTSHTPSPLVAARAAAASLALQVNASAVHVPSSGTWPPLLQSRPTVDRNGRRSEPHAAAPSVFGGMVKLEPTSQAFPGGPFVGNGHKKPLPSVYSSPSPTTVFRSIISKPAVPETPTPAAHVHRTPAGSVHSAAGMLSKRHREGEGYDESFHRHMNEIDEEFDGSMEDGDYSRSGKRACLPKKCDFPLCKNSSRSRGFCYSHGGGRRCRVDGCANGAVSRDLCKRHGGGRRCRVSGCKSSSESGGLCYSHGGGRRCNLSWCNARAKKGGYCAAHVDNRNALPPVDLVENEREEGEEASTNAPVKIASNPSDTVNPQVIETLLLLSKSPSQSDAEDSVEGSPTAASQMLSPRLHSHYSIASILN